MHAVRFPVSGSKIAVMPFFVAIAPVRRGREFCLRRRAAVVLDSRTGRLGATLKRLGLGSLRERIPNSRMEIRGRRDCSLREESWRSFPARRGDMVVVMELI